MEGSSMGGGPRCGLYNYIIEQRDTIISIPLPSNELILYLNNLSMFADL